MAGLIEAMMHRKQQQDDEEKNRARKFKALVEYGDSSGLIPKDRAITMDLDSLEGALRGHAAAAGMEKIRQETGKAQLASAAILDALAKENAFTQDYREMSAPNPAAAKLGAAPMMKALDPGLASTLSGLGEDRQPSGDEIMHMMFKAGMPPTKIDDVARALHSMSVARVTKPTPTLGFEEDPVSGTRFATLGNSMQPSGVNPAKIASAAVPIIQGDNTVGYRYNTPKGPNIHWLPESGFPQDASIQTENGVNVVKDKSGRILKTIGQVNPLGIMLQDVMTGGKPAATAPDRGTSRPAAATPSGTATKGKSAAPGYKVGAIYKGGLKYLGGDINDPNSWEKLK